MRWPLEDNLGYLNVQLTDEQLAALNRLAGFEIGFPLSFLHSDHVRGLIFGDTFARLDNHRAAGR